MAVSEEDSLRMRAAAMEKALSGDVEGALNLAAIHDMVTGKGDSKKAKGKDDKKK